MWVEGAISLFVGSDDLLVFMISVEEAYVLQKAVAGMPLATFTLTLDFS
jgi:hypothetical protein